MIISGWWSTLSALSRLARAVYGRNDVLTRQWINQHQEHLAAYDRILEYTRLSAITTSWFTSLRGYPASENECRNALILGAMTPLYDDLMDEESLTHEEILTSQHNSNQALHTVRNILDELSTNSPDKDLFTQMLHVSGKAQDNSLRQLKKALLSSGDLINITAEKGAAFTLIYRVILDHSLSDKEEEAIHTLGFLLQLTNDLFDVHKDLTNNQQTLLTVGDDLDYVHQLWTDHLQLFQKQWLSLPYSPKAIRQTLFQIALILGRGQVALDQLLQLAATSEGRFDPKDHTRQQLICDMEKPANLWANLAWANSWCTLKQSDL